MVYVAARHRAHGAPGDTAYGPTVAGHGKGVPKDVAHAESTRLWILRDMRRMSFPQERDVTGHQCPIRQRVMGTSQNRCGATGLMESKEPAVGDAGLRHVVLAPTSGRVSQQAGRPPAGLTPGERPPAQVNRPQR